MTDPGFEKGGGRFHEIFKIKNYIVNLTSNFRQKESGVSSFEKGESTPRSNFQHNRHME